MSDRVQRVRVAVDAMGGDRAPEAPVVGSLAALAADPEVSIVLVGDPAAIARVGSAHGLAEATQSGRVRIHDAPEAAGADEDPVRAVRRSTRVSARACVELLRNGDVDGVVNMGSTGAAVAAATLYGKRLGGVKRLGIAVPFPRPNGTTVLLDGGANPDAGAEELLQYAVMGTHYVRAAFGVAEPRVGILSIGEEEHKGNRLVAETWARFRAERLERFVGNVEPRELFADKADVVVTEGFAGNVALKAVEGMAEFLLGFLGRLLVERAVPDAKGIVHALAGRVDYSRYGGAPLLGVDGGYIIGHGRSGPEAFTHAIAAVKAYVVGKVGTRVVEELAARRAAGDAANPTASPA